VKENYSGDKFGSRLKKKRVIKGECHEIIVFDLFIKQLQRAPTASRIFLGVLMFVIDSPGHRLQ
jgi:hypothetical protein